MQYILGATITLFGVLLAGFTLFHLKELPGTASSVMGLLSFAIILIGQHYIEDAG
jgi:hypothetical protein